MALPASDFDVAAHAWDVKDLEGLLFKDSSNSKPLATPTTSPSPVATGIRETSSARTVDGPPIASSAKQQALQTQQANETPISSTSHTLFAPTPAFSVISGSELARILNSISASNLADLKPPYIINTVTTTATSSVVSGHNVIGQKSTATSKESGFSSLTASSQGGQQSSAQDVRKVHYIISAAATTAPSTSSSAALILTASTGLGSISSVHSSHLELHGGASSQESTVMQLQPQHTTTSSGSHYSSKTPAQTSKHSVFDTNRVSSTSYIQASDSPAASAATAVINKSTSTNIASTNSTSTNSTGTNSTKNTRYKMPEVFIILIVLAAVFVLAILFYFFMRYRKNRNRPLSPFGSQPPSPGPDPLVSDECNEAKYPFADKRNSDLVADSGTSFSVGAAMIDHDSRRMQDDNPASPESKRAYRHAVIVDSLIDTPSAKHYQSPLRHEVVAGNPMIASQDAAAANNLAHNYHSYRRQGTKSADSYKGYPHSANATESLEHSGTGNTKESKGRMISVPVGAMPVKRAQSINHKARSYNAEPAAATAAAAIALATANHAQRHLQVVGTSLVSTSYQESGSADVAKEVTFAVDRQNSECTTNNDDIIGDGHLLDTSSANPGIASMGNRPTNLSVKRKKLTRDSIKRGKDVERKPSSPSKGAASIGDATSSNDNTSTGRKIGNNLSLLSMFRSSTLSTKKKKSKNVAGSSNALDLITLVPGIEDNEGCAQSSNPALIESIESISECYQFAIRHKPPLGPLRAVEDHIPSLPDELVVRKANSLYVVGEFADGWVLAINASYNNACGMIPRRCLFFPVAPFMTKEAVEASAPPSTKSDSSFPIPDSKADLQN